VVVASEDVFGDTVPVVVRPSPQDGVEETDEIHLLDRLFRLDDSPHLGEVGLDVRFRGLDK